MKEMTEERAEYLDELYTRTTPEVDGTKLGYFAKKHPQNRLVYQFAPDVDSCLRTYAAKTHQSQTEVIEALVRKELEYA
jgi:hypothetical protein